MASIDYSSFPHIVEQIVGSSKPSERLRLRGASTGFRNYIESTTKQHIVACATSTESVESDIISLFFRYPSGETVPRLRCALRDDDETWHDWQKEEWQYNHEACEDLLVIDVDADLLDLPTYFAFWKQAFGIDFTTKIVRTDCSVFHNLTSIAPKILVELSERDNDMLPIHDKRSRYAAFVRNTQLDAQLEHFVLTVFLYGNCRPLTHKVTPASASASRLKTVTVVFTHKGDSHLGRLEDRPQADGDGALTCLIEGMAGEFPRCTFTFVGLVEHVVQLGMMDSPTNAEGMYAHLMRLIAAEHAAQKRIADGIARSIDNPPTNKPAPPIPSIRLLTHDEYRQEVGNYVYDLYTFQHWKEVTG